MLQTKLSKYLIILTVVASFHLINLESIVAHATNLSNLDNHEQKVNQKKCKDKNLDQAKIDKIRFNKLTKIAQYFDIQVEGKTIDQLKAEIEQAKNANPEKWALLKEEMHKKRINILQQK